MSQALEYLKKKVSPTDRTVEQRVAVIGTKKSGKSTCLGCLHITAIDLANDPKQNFLCRVNEQPGLGIRTAASDLRNGKFPPETPEGYIFEADMIMKWKTVSGTRTVRLPFVETAGEEVQKLITRFSEGMYDLNPEHYQHAKQLHEFILDSNGFIIITPTTRARIGGVSLEPEPVNLWHDPDVNISRLLDCVYDYKERTGSAPIKSLAVLLTKYDLVMDNLLAQGIDLNKIEGITKFMNAYFPETHSVLRFFGIERVRFFPTWVDLEKDPKTGEYILDESGNYKIKVYAPKDVQKYGIRIPYYSRPSYINLVQWIRENFAS